jgi:hypothetical protein
MGQGKQPEGFSCEVIVAVTYKDEGGLGAAVRSIDEVVPGEKTIDDAVTPQD